jgi:hypothetical protein
MEEWWEFRLALDLAPQNWGEIIPLLWWFRSIWFWVPLVGVIWINDFNNSSGSWYRTSFLPFCLMFLFSIGILLAKLTIPHPPCEFLKIQEVIPHGFYFCEGMGGLPEMNSLLMSGLLGYSMLFCSFSGKIWLSGIAAVGMILSGLASILLVQAFVSDVLAGWVLGILLTFVLQKLLRRLI